VPTVTSVAACSGLFVKGWPDALVTRRRIRVNRTATAWLIRRFIDPNAAFLFVAPEEVAEIERTTGAIGFDAPGARYPRGREWDALYASLH
jgi:hypothetical protein